MKNVCDYFYYFMIIEWLERWDVIDILSRLYYSQTSGSVPQWGCEFEGKPTQIFLHYFRSLNESVTTSRGSATGDSIVCTLYNPMKRRALRKCCHNKNKKVRLV